MADQKLYDLLYTYHTQLQGVANDLASKLDKIIGSTDAKVLDAILRKIGKTEPDIKREMERLSELMKALKDIRAESFETAKRTTLEAGSHLVNISCDRERAMSEFYAKSGKFNRELTKKQQQKILDYQPIDGQSINQWFSSLQVADLQRLTQAVQASAMDRLSLADVAKKIRGTKENGYTDGILNTSRSSAQTIARTIVNGVSNHARLETMLANADVIDGVRFLATLDGKTCPFCAVYDGKIWEENEYDQIRRPPLHRNCRCTLIPYIKAGGELNNRPAANADFDKLAEDSYNENAKQNGWKRRWSDLSQSTRLKYYYQAQKDFEKAGTPAYRQVSNDTTFADYFANQPSEFQRSWLGGKRYELYTDGKLPFDKLVSPDTGYVVTLKEMGVSEPPTVKPSPLKPAISTPLTPKEVDALRDQVIEQVRKMPLDANWKNVPEAIEAILRSDHSLEIWRGVSPETVDPLKLADKILSGHEVPPKTALARHARIVRQKAGGLVSSSKEYNLIVDEEMSKIRKELDVIQAEQRKLANASDIDTPRQKFMLDAKAEALLSPVRQRIRERAFPVYHPNGLNQRRMTEKVIVDGAEVELEDGKKIHVREIYRGTKVRDISMAERICITDELKRVARIFDSFGVEVLEDNIEIHGMANRGFYYGKDVFSTHTKKDLIFLSGSTLNEVAATLHHEFGHLIELNAKEAAESIDQMYVKITTNKKTGVRNPRKKIPKYKGEWYREANIDIPKIRPNNPLDISDKYALKDYNRPDIHELFSMFLQHVRVHPELLAEYPEYVDSMLQAMR